MTAARRQALRSPSRLWPFKSRDDIVTIVDLGAQKVACAIASLTAPRFGLDVGARNVRVLGSATVRSSGFSGGRIVNIAAAETSVRRAVAQAESQSGVTAGDVIVTGQFEGLATQIFEAKPGSGQTAILKEDAAAISAAAEEQCSAERRKLLHMFVFTAADIDIRNFDNPSVTTSDEVDVIAISMPMKGARQIAACLSRSMLTVRGFIAGPLATALAVTDSLERTAGILVIDIGAECTGYALFVRGVPVALECVNSGGQTMTDHIARTFILRKFDAELTKIRYGSAYDGLQADIDLPIPNGETGEPISKFAVNHLIRLNASLVFRAINERLKCAGYSIPSGGTVLAGGGSLLPGIRELASHLLASEVRTAKPTALNGLSAGTSLAALVGGCLYASRHQSAGEMRYAPGIVSQDSSYAFRIGQWLRASF
ncbi:MAG: cell division FtsA domain-containing protein [Rhodomicrobium sp.]